MRSSGKLRMGVGLVPTFATKDPNSGELRGIAIELGRALAERLGVEIKPVTYPSPGNLPEALKQGAWDIAFLSIDPARATVMDFSVPYAEVESTFLVAPGQNYGNVHDLDRPGVRIAVTRNSVEDLALSREIHQAEIVRADAVGEAFALLKAGKADAQAIPRPVALGFSRQLLGSSVVGDRYAVALHAIAVPKGESDLLTSINDFIGNAKRTGFIRQAMERVGLQGAQVAPD